MNRSWNLEAIKKLSQYVFIYFFRLNCFICCINQDKELLNLCITLPSISYHINIFIHYIVRYIFNILSVHWILQRRKQHALIKNIIQGFKLDADYHKKAKYPKFSWQKGNKGLIGKVKGCKNGDFLLNVLLGRQKEKKT